MWDEDKNALKTEAVATKLTSGHSVSIDPHLMYHMHLTHVLPVCRSTRHVCPSAKIFKKENKNAQFLFHFTLQHQIQIPKPLEPLRTATSAVIHSPYNLILHNQHRCNFNWAFTNQTDCSVNWSPSVCEPRDFIIRVSKLTCKSEC